MVLSRDELLATLFRETDRAQRLRSPLALIYLGIAAPTDRPSQFGPAAYNAAVDGVTCRIMKLLRCYDSIGEVAKGEFVLVLPGCSKDNAAAMARRLQAEAFVWALNEGAGLIAPSGYFGVAASKGRSALVVLREAESAFRKATALGAGAVAICHPPESQRVTGA